MAEIVEYIRSKKYREIVEEKIEIIYKKDNNGNQLTEWVNKKDISTYVLKGKVDRKRLWVRLGRGKPIGVIVSSAPGSIGWSMVKHPDRFTKEEALKFARAREMNPNPNENIPYSIRNQVQILIEKSKKVTNTN